MLSSAEALEVDAGISVYSFQVEVGLHDVRKGKVNTTQSHPPP